MTRKTERSRLGVALTRRSLANRGVLGRGRARAWARACGLPVRVRARGADSERHVDGLEGGCAAGGQSVARRRRQVRVHSKWGSSRPRVTVDEDEDAHPRRNLVGARARSQELRVRGFRIRTGPGGTLGGISGERNF